MGPRSYALCFGIARWCEGSPAGSWSGGSERFSPAQTFRGRGSTHVSVRGRFFEVDCLWAAQRLVVELDGRESHGTELTFEKDRERDRLLLVEGWRVTRITWRQLRDDAPAVIADFAQSDARRAAASYP